ncbi:ABC transporter substrate-binding protein [Salipiger aestuarii]|uniref:ABC transporter substrate-binding protein n=1 Tax=Salipiger aestuarii TaxID=568098 RepID=UPI00025B8AE3|nr:ABC transporter substrate-binding protein [Salipiger aestuarii]EIE49132.1 extracellular solute-binding protein [Citreicella sp. 357]KAA8613992.1 ABC transporter substrate-binding protein [Salipiger aestuarii]
MTAKRSRVGAAALGAALLPAAALAEGTLTISVYSFAQDEFQEIVYDPFMEICDCEIVVETGNSVERLAKIEANKDAPVIDMAVLSTHDALGAARKGLLAPIDVASLKNHDKLYDIAKDPLGDNLGVGYTFYATSIVYRSDKVTVESWADLLSPELAGNVALPDVTTNQGPPALYMIGEAMGDADYSLSAPIEEVAAHADDIVTFYVRSSQLAQLMQQEEIWAAPVGRFAWGSFKDNGLSMAWATPTEGQTGGMNVMVMTANNGNEDLATRFMDFWLSTEVQTKLAEALVDSPANAEVVVSDEIADNLTYGAETVASLKLLPPDVILDQRETWLDQWNSKVMK